jgi:hypothetical protein
MQIHRFGFRSHLTETSTLPPDLSKPPVLVGNPKYSLHKNVWLRAPFGTCVTNGSRNPRRDPKIKRTWANRGSFVEPSAPATQTNVARKHQSDLLLPTHPHDSDFRSLLLSFFFKIYCMNYAVAVNVVKASVWSYQLTTTRRFA